MGNIMIGGYNPPRVFTLVKNTTAATTVIGDCLSYDFTTEVDGYSVIQPTTAMLFAPAGVAFEAVGDDEWLRTVVYGYVESCAVIGHASMAAGTMIEIANTVDYANYTTTYAANVIGVTAEAYTTTTVEATKKAFIRCM